MELFKIMYTIIFVLFLPGLILSYVLFTHKSLDLIERAAISFALSIMVVPLMVLVMNILGVPINFISITYQVLFIICLVTIVVLCKFLTLQIQKYVKK
jgi:uncharacterized membrane protein